jgi:hypothetical protein
MEKEVYLIIAPYSSINPVRQTIASFLKISDANCRYEKLNLLEKKSISNNQFVEIANLHSWFLVANETYIAKLKN